MEIGGMGIGTIIGLAVAGLAVLVVVFGSFFTVEQQTVGTIERFGKFVRLARAGLNFKIPLIESVAHRMSLQVRQLMVEDIETRTSDKVIVKIKVAVQYFVIDGKVYDACYKLAHAEAQIKSYVYDVVRAEVPKLSLDDTFAKKDDIAHAVKDQLAGQMDDYGYGIQNALVVDIDPDKSVKDAMNEINAAQRHQEAAKAKAQADKTLLVTKAEAEAEAMKLEGQGIADQRAAIIKGLKVSVDELKAAIPGADPEHVMSFIMMTRYFDTLEKIGATGSRVIFLPHSPGGLSDITSQIRTAMLSASEAETPKAGNGASAAV
jgi:regulator of protease activity HflC (stomatin/prohibitin superfamily)